MKEAEWGRFITLGSGVQIVLSTDGYGGIQMIVPKNDWNESQLSIDLSRDDLKTIKNFFGRFSDEIAVIESEEKR